MARKLLLVPILVIALFVTALQASAGGPPAGKGWNKAESTWSPSGYTDYKPAGHGDGRRIK